MPGDRRGIEIASVFRGALADVDTVRRLPPLAGPSIALHRLGATACPSRGLRQPET